MGLAAGGAVAGMGFTVALLIATIAFDGQTLAEAKLGVLGSAVVAPLLAWLVFRGARLLPAPVRARQVARTADELLDLADEVDPRRDHIRGSDTATVTLLEYGDFECPYCGQAESIVRDLLASFGDELRYVWRHLPLNDVHTHAQMAAEAAEAAATQGAFWEMYDRLLTHQDELDADDLRRHAQELGLDVERFWEELHGRRHAPRIAQDVATADASGVAGTPTFFVNGQRHHGAYDVATLSEAVQRARRRERSRLVAAG